MIYILKLLGVATLYALIAKVVLVFFSANGVVSIVWPPSGLALAVLLIGGKRYSPGVFFGAFLANAMTGLSLGVSAAIAAGNTLEAFLGAWLLTRDSRFDSNLRALSDYLRLIVLGGFVACSVAALNGSTTLLVSGFITHAAYSRNLLHWWMGDVLGIVLIAPMILTWRRIPNGWLEPKHMAEAMLLLGLMFLANQVVFLEWFHDTTGVFEQVARGYWMFLLVTWVAIRLGTSGVVIALVMTASQALLGAALGIGFFASDMAKTGLVTYWFYTMVLSVVGMALATYFAGREQMEEALRRSEENLNRAQAVGQIGSWFLDIPVNRLEWSAETYRMFGVPPQKHDIDLETFTAIIHPDDRDFAFRAWSEAMAGAPYDIEHRIVVDGQTRWVRERAQIERDAKGCPLAGVGIVQDITERKQAEELIKINQARFSTIFNQAPLGIALIDSLTGKFYEINPRYAEIAGRTIEEMLTIDWMSITHPDDVQGDLDNMALLNSGKISSFKMDKRYILPDGSIVWINMTIVPLRMEKDASPCHIAMVDDITQRKEYEEELKRSNADLEQFSYAVSHDMRQPLRMISSYLQLIEMNLGSQLDDEKRGYFNFAIEGARRIDQMLVALLEYSRVGRLGEPPSRIDSRALLDEALQFLQPAIAEAQATLSITGDWPNILVSHDEMLRLIQNLIGNAVKFHVSGQAPEITVNSEAVGNEWRLCVTDNGAGIVPGQAKRLFQVFQRLQSRDAYEGTGIGLALCRKIAEHHKGRIWAESEGEGRGSRFYVVLPVLYKKPTLQ